MLYEVITMEPILPELLLIGIAVMLIGCDLFLPRQRQLLPWLTVMSYNFV